ncbi:argininosuccinate lyase [uncultured Marivirga sp.]|uniref:argininosuccinate lyase n=1 Tax=uncultured Marivirga sp. TaxID=1123707 RepID=UPI0030ECFC09|tara:strand:- start:238303 stop:239634 length:1332 start_codon:yes stop_codon:yes gene_type:complete
MKIWQKNTDSLKEIEQFTIGKDTEFDLLLAPYDVLGSIAHITMLAKIQLISDNEFEALSKELKNIHQEIQGGKFQIQEGVEDIHSQIEFLLTERLGDIGKKIHSGRSRNDQVLVDLKLFYRDKVKEIVESSKQLFDLLLHLAEKHKQDLMPGYTHTQLAMPSSFGLWFSSFAESLAEDMDILFAAFQIIDKNPLGSAAGYGSSFPLDRTFTTEILGFSDMHHNVINAQSSRGKTEKTLAFALSAVGGTLNRMASDICLFMNQHFAFVSFPDEFTTGSSIMPHKKNPDVMELVRAKSNQLHAIPNAIILNDTNLTTGYHRDKQLLKEYIFPGIETTLDCLNITHFMLKEIKLEQNILEDKKYQYLFSVEEVNRLVKSGISFRDAYKKVGLDIDKGDFKAATQLDHTHEGSIGNLCLEEINEKMQSKIKRFNFSMIELSKGRLLG